MEVSIILGWPGTCITILNVDPSCTAVEFTYLNLCSLL